MEMASTRVAAAPVPASARAAIIIGSEVAKAAATVNTTNMLKPASRMDRRPKRSASGP